ncbi:hypothetical protein Chor_012654 [Crotalus horridus]
MNFFTVLVTCLHVGDFAPRSPTMAEGGADGNQPPREHPCNLQGLLQMAVMASNNKPDQMEPMSDEVCSWAHQERELSPTFRHKGFLITQAGSGDVSN